MARILRIAARQTDQFGKSTPRGLTEEERRVLAARLADFVDTPISKKVEAAELRGVITGVLVSAILWLLIAWICGWL